MLEILENKHEAGLMVLQLTALAAIAENLALVPSTHIMANYFLTPLQWIYSPPLATMDIFPHAICTFMHEKHSKI